VDVAHLVRAEEGEVLVTRRWRRSPTLHFAVLGGLAFAAHTALRAPEPETALLPEPRQPIVVTRERVASIGDAFASRWGRQPTAAERQALVATEVRDEMLYREARRLALGEGDPSVERRMVEKMRALGDDPSGSPRALVERALAMGLDDDVVVRRLLVEKMRIALEAAPDASLDDAAVREYAERHRAALSMPASVTFTQVFLADGTPAEVEATRVRLAATAPSAPELASLSDPLPLGRRLRAYSHAQVLGRFGKPFADRVFALPTARWEGPLASPYGVHFVWIEERTDERLPPVEVLRPRIAADLVRERAEAQLAQGLQNLARLYEVRVEDPA
jgi:hypothetical protein